MIKGRIMKVLSNLYTVDSHGNVIECIPRGKFRYTNQKPIVGDIVTIQVDENNKGYIMEIDERKNQLVRPPIANIDQAIVVFSSKEPRFSFQLLDRFLAIIEHHRITPIIIITKSDLLEEVEEIQTSLNSYIASGYSVIYTSAKNKEGLEQLPAIFKDKISVFTGQSGVGKSSLLNAIDDSLQLETNQISKALGRGKHTTRHVELLPFYNGLIADTPGFSSLSFDALTTRDLAVAYHDFREYAKECKFRGCLHENEPNCRVKEAVRNGEIIESRYINYISILEEIKNRKEIY